MTTLSIVNNFSAVYVLLATVNKLCTRNSFDANL